jgi:hypothetical protein
MDIVGEKEGSRMTDEGEEEKEESNVIKDIVEMRKKGKKIGL